MKTMMLALIGVFASGPALASAWDPPHEVKFYIEGQVIEVVSAGVLIKCRKSTRVGMPEPLNNSIVLVRGVGYWIAEGAKVQVYALADGVYDYLNEFHHHKTIQAFKQTK